MVVHKRRKTSRQRGSSTHGWGMKKKHRGAGSRGGRGMAGTGKRADQKKISILKFYGPEYFGKHGFKRPQIYKKEKTVNIRDLPSSTDVNLTKMGYDKLLAKGTPRMKYMITVEKCSKRAKEKIEQAGGKVVLKE